MGPISNNIHIVVVINTATFILFRIRITLIITSKPFINYIPFFVGTIISVHNNTSSLYFFSRVQRVALAATR